MISPQPLNSWQQQSVSPAASAECQRKRKTFTVQGACCELYQPRLIWLSKQIHTFRLICWGRKGPKGSEWDNPQQASAPFCFNSASCDSDVLGNINYPALGTDNKLCNVSYIFFFFFLVNRLCVALLVSNKSLSVLFVFHRQDWPVASVVAGVVVG